jgi:hypothetical protein
MMATVHYCDLCAVPLKGTGAIYTLYISKMDANDYENDADDANNTARLHKHIKDIERDIQEICPSCKLVYDKIFELRFQNLSMIASDLLGIYNLKSRESVQEKEAKKKRKTKGDKK